MARRLPNYLLTYRKRTGLSQDEVAFLLGCGDGTMVSRYEHGRRRPSLAGILSYEMVLGVPARELFAGVSCEVEETMMKRAQVLARRLDTASGNPVIARKLDLLKQLATGPARERQTA